MKTEENQIEEEKVDIKGLLFRYYHHWYYFLRRVNSNVCHRILQLAGGRAIQ